MWMRGGRKKENERITALEQAVEGLQSSNRLLKLEWEAVFDKLNRTMGRLNARIRRDASQNEPESNAEDSPAPTPRVGTHDQLQAHRSRHGLLSR